MTTKQKLASYAPMFKFASGEVCGNAERYATFEEAENSARDRFAVWTMPTGFCVHETTDPINYRYTIGNGRMSLRLDTSPQETA